MGFCGVMYVLNEIPRLVNSWEHIANRRFLTFKFDCISSLFRTTHADHRGMISCARCNLAVIAPQRPTVPPTYYHAYPLFTRSIRKYSLNHIHIIQLSTARIHRLEQLIHLLITHLLAQICKDIPELSHADEARQVLIEHLEASAVFFRLAWVAEAAGSVEYAGEGVEVDYSIPVSTEAGIRREGEIWGGKEGRRGRDACSHRRLVAQGRGFLLELDFGRMRVGGRLGSRERRGRCRVCRRGRRLL